MSKKSFIITLFILLFSFKAVASSILIPMDAESQENHLKAYGITYWVLLQNVKVKWLLNYRGGSFLLPDAETFRRECQIRGVSFEIISDSKTQQILEEIENFGMSKDKKDEYLLYLTDDQILYVLLWRA